MKFALLSSFLLMATLAANPLEVEKIPFPPHADDQVGGLDVLPDGRVAACFHRGDVRIYNPADQSWSLFAYGLHEPLGLVAESATSFVIMQRPELTRVQDMDGDGKADHYETVWDDFGMTGNYHEFAFGPTRDPDGHWVIGLNVASNGASIRPEVRGEFLNVGLPREKFYEFAPDWSKKKGPAGRMYSRVPWRGWVVRINKDTGATEPIASGLRSPNGLGYDTHGNLFVSDNQGDWLGTSKLHHIQQGHFHGHPASLPWREDYDGRPPLEIPVEELEEMRTPAAVWFTQGSMANSPTQPILIPETFGPFGGQMLIGEMNRARIVRLLMEEVNGVMQGACVPFLDDKGLTSGVNRLAFSPDGKTLWTGHTHLSWAGSQGMRKVTYAEEAVVNEVLNLTIQPDGFHVELTQPADDLGDFQLQRYTFAYHAAYGSKQLEQVDVAATVEKVSDTKFALKLAEPLKKDFAYEFQFPTVTNGMVCYTVREIPEG